MEPLIANCGQLGREFGVTTILTHHSRKSTEGSDAQAVLGSTSIAAQPDTLLRLSVNRSSGNRKLSIESRYAQLDDPESVEMAIDQGTGEYLLVIPHADLDELILEAIDDGYTARKPLAEFLTDKIENGDANKIVGRRLSALVKEGKLVMSGNGIATKYVFHNDVSIRHFVAVLAPARLRICIREGERKLRLKRLNPTPSESPATPQSLRGREQGKSC